MTGSLWPQDSAVEQPVGGTQRAYCRYGRWCTSGGFYCVCSMVGWLLRVILRVLQNWLYRSLSMLLTASLLFVCNTYFQHPFFSFKNEECYFVTLAVVHELMPLVQASDITPYHIIMNVVSIILNQIYSILFLFYVRWLIDEYYIVHIEGQHRGYVWVFILKPCTTDGTDGQAEDALLRCSLSPLFFFQEEEESTSRRTRCSGLNYLTVAKYFSP